jgi:GntR family transcriptional regulator / MocR family aminotransferase
VAGPQTNLAWETLLDLSASRPGPLHLRLRSAIRAAIRDGRLPLGAAVPPTRTLATDLGVSRWTVTQAYSLLIAEGYLAGRTGSATRVSWSPDPGADRDARPVRPSETPPRPARFDLSPGRPDLRAFPRRKWAEAVRTAAETACCPMIWNSRAPKASIFGGSLIQARGSKSGLASMSDARTGSACRRYARASAN